MVSNASFSTEERRKRRVLLTVSFKGTEKRFLIKRQQKMEKAMRIFSTEFQQDRSQLRFRFKDTPLTGEETADTANINDDDRIIMSTQDDNVEIRPGAQEENNINSINSSNENQQHTKELTPSMDNVTNRAKKSLIVINDTTTTRAVSTMNTLSNLEHRNDNFNNHTNDLNNMTNKNINGLKAKVTNHSISSIMELSMELRNEEDNLNSELDHVVSAQGTEIKTITSKPQAISTTSDAEIQALEDEMTQMEIKYAGEIKENRDIIHRLIDNRENQSQTVKGLQARCKSLELLLETQNIVNPVGKDVNKRLKDQLREQIAQNKAITQNREKELSRMDKHVKKLNDELEKVKIQGLMNLQNEISHLRQKQSDSREEWQRIYDDAMNTYFENQNRWDLYRMHLDKQLRNSEDLAKEQTRKYNDQLANMKTTLDEKERANKALREQIDAQAILNKKALREQLESQAVQHKKALREQLESQAVQHKEALREQLDSQAVLHKKALREQLESQTVLFQKEKESLKAKNKDQQDKFTHAYLEMKKQRNLHIEQMNRLRQAYVNHLKKVLSGVANTRPSDEQKTPVAYTQMGAARNPRTAPGLFHPQMTPIMNTSSVANPEMTQYPQNALNERLVANKEPIPYSQMVQTEYPNLVPSTYAQMPHVINTQMGQVANSIQSTNQRMASAYAPMNPVALVANQQMSNPMMFSVTNPPSMPNSKPGAYSQMCSATNGQTAPCVPYPQITPVMNSPIAPVTKPAPQIQIQSNWILKEGKSTSKKDPAEESVPEVEKKSIAMMMPTQKNEERRCVNCGMRAQYKMVIAYCNDLCKTEYHQSNC